MLQSAEPVQVLEAAVIGMAHPKWTERPLLVVVTHPGRQPSKDELLGYFQVCSLRRSHAVECLLRSFTCGWIGWLQYQEQTPTLRPVR